MTAWIRHALRLAIIAFSLIVLGNIVPISIAQWQTGDACPMLGPVPACYVVSICYAAMGIAALLWGRAPRWLFAAGALPVLLLALTGSSLELFGRPTCPRSETGWPLCYNSLIAAVLMLAAYGMARWKRR